MGRFGSNLDPFEIDLGSVRARLEIDLDTIWAVTLYNFELNFDAIWQTPSIINDNADLLQK